LRSAPSPGASTPASPTEPEARAAAETPEPAPAKATAAEAQAATTSAPERLAAESRRALIERRLALLELDRRRRGILEEDLPHYLQARQAARRALAASDLVRAEAQVERLSAQLQRARVDEPFVARKLARLNGLLGRRKLDPKSGAQVRKAFARVHARFFAGDYQTANQHLNTIWLILRDGAGGR
jgi:hypothetical protein